MREIQLLSIGAYHVSITSGHGSSVWNGMAVTRWHDDATLEPGGARCHVLDHAVPIGETAGPRRTLCQAKTGEHDFRDGRTVVCWRDEALEIRSELAVAIDDPVEFRRLVIRNLCDGRRTLSATTYAEIVLSPPATDSAHPAFSKLFVETEIDTGLQAILATRLPACIAANVVVDVVRTTGDTLTLVDDGRAHVALAPVVRPH